jgi:hypothetical protein
VAPDLLIVDESHRFRSTTARRYDALARLAARTPLLLLSATPLQNSTRDLAAQLALFLGERAWRMDERALARYVVRGGVQADAALPAIAPPAWVRPTVDDGDLLGAILALPPPARALDAGDGGALRVIGLVRAWASSRAALRAALRRREQAVAAIEQSVASGRAPTKREIRSWQGPDADVQLGFVPLLVEHAVDPALLDEAVGAVARERTALRELAGIVARTPDPDLARVDALRSIRARHAEARVLAFSEHAATVRAYYAALRGDPGVGLLTASDARIASGKLPRDALLARFAPRAQGAPDPPSRERVSLLLTTDLLSEGVNLQDASVVVHLDLPWNPARLAQRVGRLRRPGGAALVHSYLVAPPARAALLLDVERRLRRKLACAERAIGRGVECVPRLSSVEPPAVAVHHVQRHLAPATGSLDATALGMLADRLAGWRLEAPYSHAGQGAPVVAAVQANVPGWLAALHDGRLVAALGGGPPDTESSVQQAAGAAEGSACPADARHAAAALREVDAWLAAERLTETCGLTAEPTALELALEHAVTAALRQAPRHRQATVSALTTRIRARLARPRSLGVERELAGLLARRPRASDSAEEWLLELARQLGERRSGEAGAPPGVVALILLATAPPPRSAPSRSAP